MRRTRFPVGSAVIDRTDKSETPRCAQCNSGSPDNGFTTKVVIHQNWVAGKKVVSQSRFTVCQGTACGGNLQMAHEG